ncbi:MAG: hypothetical protein ABI877_01435 [Gemmatimonadaceae bacterium]
MSLQRRTLQETQTSMPVSEVLSDAKEFFAKRSSIYSAFVEQESAVHVTLRGLGGEEIVIAASATPNGTSVRGSSYMFDAQVSRFFSTLPPVAEVVA